MTPWLYLNVFLKGLNPFDKSVQFSLKTKLTDESVIFMVDGSKSHGGLTDRLKGMISSYFLSQHYRLNFFLFYQFPFDFNKIWFSKSKNIQTLVINPFKVKIWHFSISSMKNGYDSFLKLPFQGKTNLIYSNVNLLSYDENNKPWQPIFVAKYLELKGYFEDKLAQSFSEKHPIIKPKQYAVIHFRCMNYFGDFEDSGLPTLSLDEQENIIIAISQEIQLLRNKFDSTNYFIISDSRKLLIALQNRGFNVFDTKETAHIDVAGYPEDFYMRGFEEFLLLQNSNAIQSIILFHERKAFNSHYAYMASILGDASFTKFSFDVNKLKIYEL
jgi:hypothetical protein